MLLKMADPGFSFECSDQNTEICDANDCIKFDQRAYMARQIEEIKKYKWIQSEKNGCDLGDHAIREWIHLYACEFREWAMKSPEFYTE